MKNETKTILGGIGAIIFAATIIFSLNHYFPNKAQAQEPDGVITQFYLSNIENQYKPYVVLFRLEGKKFVMVSRVLGNPYVIPFSGD
jgi:hypothetical protein